MRFTIITHIAIIPFKHFHNTFSVNTIGLIFIELPSTKQEALLQIQKALTLPHIDNYIAFIHIFSQYIKYTNNICTNICFILPQSQNTGIL